MGGVFSKSPIKKPQLITVSIVDNVKTQYEINGKKITESTRMYQVKPTTIEEPSLDPTNYSFMYLVKYAKDFAEKNYGKSTYRMIIDNISYEKYDSKRNERRLLAIVRTTDPKIYSSLIDTTIYIRYLATRVKRKKNESVILSGIDCCYNNDNDISDARDADETNLQFDGTSSTMNFDVLSDG